MVWQTMRVSGFRILFTGVFSLAIAFIFYARLSGAPLLSQQLSNLAVSMLAITAAAVACTLYGAYRIFRSEQARTAGSSSLMSFITGAFAGRRSWQVMIITAVAYGVFFGFLSQIFVYRPDVSLAEQGITVPSVELIPCCGPPGYVPMITAYITDNFLLLVIPLNVILAVWVSVMVGFNAAISVYAYRLGRSMQAKTSLVGGIGATAGLFVGCPTCAGSLISAALGLGVAGAGASVGALAPFQTLFIAASIPALAIAPFLLARSIKSFSSCAAK